MAFPNTIDTITAAEDITQADLNQLNGYQQAMAQGNFALAQTYLTAMTDGLAKQFNASRFNQLITILTNIENFYLGLNGVKAYISENISKFTNIYAWSATTTYGINNTAILNNTWYYSLTANNVGNNPATDTTNWAVLIAPQYAKQYFVGTTQPSTLPIGELWFKTTT